MLPPADVWQGACPLRYSPAVVPSDDVAIEFRDVSFTRGSKTILQNTSFRVTPGETVVLVGLSGAGKSTILKLINRMLSPTAGLVIVSGRCTSEWDPFVLRRGIGYVLQDVGLFPHMSVAENVALVPRLSGWEEKTIATRVDELLTLVDLPPVEYARRAPDELSGGQKQRVGVARALAADPPILLMDEPFGALDPVTRAELHDALRRIQSEVRKTIVLVTHDMGEAFALATRIGVLADGGIAILDRPDDVARSNDPRVQSLLKPLLEASAALANARQ
jgi:osmoprotectant transport system ATP-binding protein